MTVSELYNQVAGLGFETSLEDNSRFFYAANRALLQVSALRPETRLYRLVHSPIGNVANEDSMNPIKVTEDVLFTAKGARSYYFECDGTGSAFIEYMKGGKWEIVGSVYLSSKDRSYVSYRGFIKDGEKFLNADADVRIRFVYSFLYNVQNVALYKQTYSAKEEDIPKYGSYYEYDISRLASDFLRLAPASIIDEENREVPVSDVYTENGRSVFVARDKEGTYLIRYIKKPEELDSKWEASSAQVIDLDEDLCYLLPNLIAAYVWAEDEPNLAEYYRDMYYKQAAELEARARHIGTANITNNGW